MPRRLPRIRIEAFAAGTATIVSIAALFVAWDQARIARTEVRAAIWPALQVDGFTSRSDDGLHAGFIVQNAGVGPAMVRQVTVTHNGDPLASYAELLDVAPPDAEMSYSTLTGRVLAAGAEVRPFELMYGPEGADAIMATLTEQADWAMEVCYCSVMEECWIRRSDDEYPAETRSCEGPRHGEF